MPTVVGVPLSRPEDELIVRPGGRLEADQVAPSMDVGVVRGLLLTRR